MIKRRFYKLEHGDRDAPSESSSSDFELEPEDAEESSGEEEEEEVDEEEGDMEEEENDKEGEIKVKEKNQSHLSSSGYESENSSANEVNLDSSGLPTSDDDAGTQHASQIAMAGHLPGKGNGESVDIRQSTTSKDDLPSNLPDCVVKCKSVFKCRLCPRIVCLSEETLRDHLVSKRHARSEKLLKEGRLKLMLNDDGKVEGDTPKMQDLSEEDEAPPPHSGKNQKGKKRNRFSMRPSNRKKGNHAKFARKDLAKRRHL